MTAVKGFCCLLLLSVWLSCFVLPYFWAYLLNPEVHMLLSEVTMS